MPLRCLLAVAAIALVTLSGCATTGSGAGNTTYATPAGIGPVRGAGINGY